MNEQLKSVLLQELKNFNDIERQSKTIGQRIREYLYDEGVSLRPGHIAKNLNMKHPSVRRSLRELLNNGYASMPRRCVYQVTKKDNEKYLKDLKNKTVPLKL